MAKDNVLRVLFIEIQNGENVRRLCDALDAGEYYQLVLEWVEWPGRESEGMAPKKSIKIKKECFEVIPSGTMPFELLLKLPINFSEFNFRDVEADMPEVWSNPDNLSQPRPDDAI